MRTRALLVSALTLALVSSARAEKDDIYAIVGARVVTVSGPVFDSASVVLRDGVIEAVGPSLAVPPDARVIDGRGWTLTPGLIDGFGGIGLPAPAKKGGEGGGKGARPGEKSNPLAPETRALDALSPAEA